MLKHELEKLVKSLSASEKKSFRSYCNKHGSTSDYLILFELISSHTISSKMTPEESFNKNYPEKSYENTVRYLYQVLTDMLLQVRVDQDKWFARHYSLMKARLCFERSLPEQALKELKKTQKIAEESQDHLVHYLAARMKLTQIADTGFPGLGEQDLVTLQMQSRQSLLNLRQIHEHYSLYELLSYRLTYSSSILSEKDKKKLNDLVLSELSLITRRGKQDFEPKKLHLLFQSFFFMHTGEYKSALKVFKELNALIQANEPMWDYPPYDYLSALDGILDSLRNIAYFSEMVYFIEKTAQLAERNYPEHFNSVATQTVYLYRLNMLVGKGQNLEAIQFFDTIKPYLNQKDGIANYEKHIEILFFAGIAFFNTGQYQKANKLIGYAIDAGKNINGLEVNKACRLLHILIHLELDNIDYLNYEIRAYKRTFRKHGKSLLIEKLIFNLIAIDPKRCSLPKKKLLWKKVEPQTAAVMADKYEHQLLKYFNFCDWIELKYKTK